MRGLTEHSISYIGGGTLLPTRPSVPVRVVHRHRTVVSAKRIQGNPECMKMYENETENKTDDINNQIVSYVTMVRWSDSGVLTPPGTYITVDTPEYIYIHTMFVLL